MYYPLNHEYRTCVNKGRRFYSKVISSVLHIDAFYQISSIFTIYHLIEFRKNAPILGNFLRSATIQERPLLARIR